MNDPYEMRIYLNGSPGYFSYYVEGKTRAMMHFTEITRSGYRRYDKESKRFVWYSPNRLHEINVIGPDLDSSYGDKFIRT